MLTLSNTESMDFVKKLHYGFLLSLSFLLIHCGSESSNEKRAPATKDPVNQPNTPTTSFKTIEVKPSSFERSINITGRIKPLETIQISAEVQGKALSTGKLLDEAVRYRKGELLVKIDDAQFSLNLQSQKSQFQAALVRIMPQIKLDYADSHKAWDEYLRKFDPSAVLAPLPEVKNEQLQFFLSANNIFSSYYSIKSAEETLLKYEIKAPFTGIITQGNVTPGTIINPNVPLATFSRTDLFEVKAAVSSTYIANLKQGQKLELTHRNTGEVYKGTIHRIGGAIDPSTQSVPVFIRVSGKHLREGMFLESSLDANTYDDIVALPLAALNRSNQVHVIQDSLVSLKDVKPLIYEQDQVWVEGLNEGEQVITEEIIEPIVGTRAISKL